MGKSSLTTLTDEELIERYKRSGSEHFINELFKRYYTVVFGLCLNFLFDKETSKDVTIIIFELLFKKIPKNDIQRFKPWLFIFVRNHCFSYLRKQKKSEEILEDWEKVEKNSDHFMENEGFVRLYNKGEDSLREKIEKALSRLPEGQALCIRLFFLEEKSYKKIVEETNYDLKQVKSFLQNGKRKLKVLLKEK